MSGQDYISQNHVIMSDFFAQLVSPSRSVDVIVSTILVSVRSNNLICSLMFQTTSESRHEYPPPHYRQTRAEEKYFPSSHVTEQYEGQEQKLRPLNRCLVLSIAPCNISEIHCYHCCRTCASRVKICWFLKQNTGICHKFHLEQSLKTKDESIS